MKKYKLYATKSGWTSRNASLESHLGIPDGEGTERYAYIVSVGNPEHADYGKFIMPVLMDGPWKCDDQFNASDLVDLDPDWNIPRRVVP